MSLRVKLICVCQLFSGVQICLLFCQVLLRRNLLMSAWAELACLQYLPGELTQCLVEVSPTACLSVSSSGSLGSFWGGLAGAFHACCPVFLTVLSTGTEVCLSLCITVCVPFVSDGVGIQLSSVPGGCQLDVFPWVFQDSVSKPIRSSSGLPLH